MTYKIIIKHKGQRKVEIVEGMRELQSALSDYRGEGIKIAGVRRVGAKRRLLNLKSLVLQ